MSTAAFNTRRVSYAHYLAAQAEQEVALDDELSNAQKRLAELKNLISTQSKKNFTLERDVRYLDGRIALLIQNRMQLDDKEAKDIQHVVDDGDEKNSHKQKLDERRLQLYGNLFYILQTETRNIATLCRLVNLDQMDNLLQTVMFTLYGNQYDTREEYLLLSMFQTVLGYQFEQATNFGSLLRANTPVSRMMTTYTRRGPGQTYLKILLSERIASLIKHKELNLEINPVKVYQQILEASGSTDTNTTLEDASNHPHVQQLVAPRVRMLLEIASSFLNTIVEGLEHVPYGIRWICKQIKGLAKRKYPEATDWQICSLIGGFFMLRFINPAIVTPQGFMLVPAAPSTHPRRTLTLIAKMLQNLANKPSQLKETYMAPLNAWADHNKEKVQAFLLSLTDVGDFYESLELDQYLALSRKGGELKISITTNEIFSTHELLLKHRDQICLPSSHLSTLLSELGPAPAPLPRIENGQHTLELVSRWETHIADCAELVKQSTDTSAAEALFLEAKSTYVQLLRRAPLLAKISINGLVDLREIADKAADMSNRDPELALMATRAISMLGELERLGVVARKDDYKILAEEIAAELAHLGDLKGKVSLEIQSLENVYRTIGEHNQYLKSQLDTYKAYLANVRMKTIGNTNGKSKKDKRKELATAAGAVITSGLGSSSTLDEVGASPQSATPILPRHIPIVRSFLLTQLEKEGVVLDSNVPDQRKPNISIGIVCASPGSFVMSLDYKGRDRPILEVELRIDDLLEKQQDGTDKLDLEYVRLSVAKLIQLLNKHF